MVLKWREKRRMSLFEFNGNSTRFFLIKFQFVQTFPMEFIYFVCHVYQKHSEEVTWNTKILCCENCQEQICIFCISFDLLALFRTLHCGLFPYNSIQLTWHISKIVKSYGLPLVSSMLPIHVRKNRCRCVLYCDDLAWHETRLFAFQCERRFHDSSKYHLLNPNRVP